MKSAWLILIFVILALQLSAQKDSFAFLQSATVTANGNSQNVGIGKFDINLKNNSTIADALQNQSALFIKQYGVGSLATASMRGLGGQHTAVLWNGFNLQSCMNSIIDFNLLPSFLIDNAAVETGANTAICGNGALAGTVYLNNKPLVKNSVFSEIKTGSFDNQSLGLGFAYGKKKVFTQTRLLYRQADNNFEYKNIFKINNPTELQTNNKLEQKGLLQEIQFIMNKQHSFFGKAWILETSRQLPLPMGVVNNANEKQYDFAQRFIIKHENNISKQIVNTNKIAFFDEELNYYNNYYPVAYSQSKTVIAECDIKIFTSKKSFFYAQINNTFTKAKTDGYSNWPERNLFSILLKYQWQLKEKLKLSAASRKQLVDNNLAPLAPDFGLDYLMLNWLTFKGNISASYRVPSFNDYYWNIGGNENLKPERGFKQEISIETKIKKSKLSSTFFNNEVNNWILWQPNQTSGIWTATNAKQVNSKGVEIAIDLNQKYRQHSLQINSRYQYVKSTNTKTDIELQRSLNKQLIYVPFHTAFVSLNYHFKNLLVDIGNQYTGSRYTTTDNDKNYKLLGFNLINTGISYLLKYKQINSVFNFKINNVLNKNYQIIENRPMPLRNYQITLKFKIE